MESQSTVCYMKVEYDQFRAALSDLEMAK